MQSRVLFCNLKAGFERTLKKRFQEMLREGGLQEAVPPGGLVAVKIHFGEPGNTAFIRPVFVRWVIDLIKEFGGKPFLTDANTLYVGSRANSVDHLQAALGNGFGYAAVGAPLVIADGLKGGSEVAVPVDGKQVKEAYLAADICAADALISLAHFKAHDLAGFGGAIKNLGMGSGSRRGKLAQHNDLGPIVDTDKCTGCGTCLEACPEGAISLEDETSEIDRDRCIGCGRCILVCPSRALEIDWNRDTSTIQETMAEYAYAVSKPMAGRLFCVNFLTQITPHCDCVPFSEAPIAPDIGFLASTDPVAVDQASWDMVTAEKSFTPEAKDGEDKFRALFPKVDPAVQLSHSQSMGLGTREYKLDRIP